MKNRLWTENELMLALRWYLQLPFGQLDQRNPQVKHLGELIGRTSSSVALRLVNFAALDPIQQQRGIKGMPNGGKKCKECWDKFMTDKESFIYESETVLANLEGKDLETKYADRIPKIPTGVKGKTKDRLLKVRVNQYIFRKIVLANYGYKCALTDIDIPELLVASHIIPWAKNIEERLNPSNGICLSSLYDKAFDVGLISFDDNYKTIFSPKLLSCVGKDYYYRFFEPYKGAKLSTPLKYKANSLFLEYHRDCIYNHL